MRIIQFIDKEGLNRVGIVKNAHQILALKGRYTTYKLASEAIEAGEKLREYINNIQHTEEVDYDELIREKRILPPITHPDPAHLLLTGTGLSHLGSANARDGMHKVPEKEMTDSMKMFQWGLEKGKPAEGEVGVQPEWFYKGDGSFLVPPYQPISSPGFALDYGEEPEIVGIYMNDKDGNPWRIGFALANEFSDHITEKQNYLYLAHSKLRQSAIGPELLLGDLPASVEGKVMIKRGKEMLFNKPFLSGEQNMSHSISNLEYHHFKYRLFRRPGDIHVHFFGTATLSFAEGIRLQEGDMMRIEASAFGRALENTVAVEPEEKVEIHYL